MDEDDIGLSDYEDYEDYDDEEMDVSGSSSAASVDEEGALEALASSDAALDDAGFNENDDAGFSQDLVKSAKKPYEVEYKVLNVESIVKEQKKEVDQVAGMFVIKVRLIFVPFA